MVDNLIFDRLTRDVEIALERPNSSEFQKGAYNYMDLNRVEQWCEYLMELLNDYGKGIELEIKMNWNLRDYPTRKQIDRIRSNLDTIKNTCYALITETIEYNNTLNYEQANILEKILFDIDEYIKEMTRTVELQYNLASRINIVKNVYMSVNTDVINEDKEVPIQDNIGAFLCSRKYINMKGV